LLKVKGLVQVVVDDQRFVVQVLRPLVVVVGKGRLEC
jgi:hypothetical protein